MTLVNKHEEAGGSPQWLYGLLPLTLLGDIFMQTKKLPMEAEKTYEGLGKNGQRMSGLASVTGLI
jgi:hypothetical protein